MLLVTKIILEIYFFKSRFSNCILKSNFLTIQCHFSRLSTKPVLSIKLYYMTTLTFAFCLLIMTAGTLLKKNSKESLKQNKFLILPVLNSLQYHISVSLIKGVGHNLFTVNSNIFANQCVTVFKHTPSVRTAC